MALHGGLSFCKTQQVVGFDCAGIERLSVPQPNSCREIVFLQRAVQYQHSQSQQPAEFCRMTVLHAEPFNRLTYSYGPPPW